MSPSETKEIVAPLLFITVTHNFHGAMGMFGSNGALLIVLAFAVLFVFFREFGQNAGSRTVQICIGMIAGGATGNIVDRVRLSYVVDFVDVKVWQEIFNVADSCIAVGISILILRSLIAEKRPSRSDTSRSRE